MNNIELYFDKPLLLLILIPALAIILVPFFRLPKKRRKTFKKTVPAVLHSIASVLLVLILSGFSVTTKSDEQAVILLVDLSDSTKDVQTEIIDRTDEILKLYDKKTPVGVVLFAKDRIYAAKLQENTRSFTVSMVSGDSTNLSAALDYAATLFPADKVGHIIILSDGKETDGDVVNSAHYLSNRGIRIDAVYFDTTGLNTDEMQIESFSTKEGAYSGDEIAFEVLLKSNVESNAVLTLFDNEYEVLSEVVSVGEGSTAYTFYTLATDPGIHSYHVELYTDADTISENNIAYTYLNVTGEPSVLIIADKLSHGEAFSSLIEDGSFVTTVTAQNAPKSITELCNYDEVVLVNVDYDSLPRNYGDLLEKYVGVYGRSLLVSGGSETLMYGNMEGTLLEEMLPVTLSLSEDAEGNSTALLLVLDCSSSMSTQSTYLSVAKQGAIKCVEALGSNDFVGVVSFNQQAYLKQSLIKATETNKQSVTRIISGLSTSRGTYYTKALQLAVEQLESSEASVKHIIFLSDGQPNDSGYTQVAKNAASLGITISTIGLGYSSNILSSLAEIAGGRYYYVTKASDLPNIMLSETEQVTVSSLITGEFTPEVIKESSLTEAFYGETLPVLNGYLGTTIKEDAVTYISVGESENPIYAVWKYGNGTVSCFTSDLYGEWTKSWINDTTGSLILSNMVSTTVDEIHHDSTLSAEITVRGSTTDITVTTLKESTGNILQAEVVYGNKSTEYTLTKISEKEYEISIPSEKAGVYQVMIYENDSDGEPVDYLEQAFAVSYSSEYDAFFESKEALLSEICGYSGGMIYQDMKALAKAFVSPIEKQFNPLVLFAILSMLLIVSDIAIRKIRWKDIKAFFIKKKK